MKGAAQFIEVLLIILLIVAILHFGGFVTLTTFQHKYLTDVQSPKTIDRYSTFKIDILITNPEKNIVYPFLEVKYNKTFWITYNRYIQNNEKIPIGPIQPGEVKRYTIEFLPKYSSIGKHHSFEFNLYIQGKIVDSRKSDVYVE